MKPRKPLTLPKVYDRLSQVQKRLVREQYVVSQNGLCHYCKAPLSEPPPKRIRDLKIDWSLFPPMFLKHPIHLHHSHDTGLTLGAVHAFCNAVLWQYEGE